MTVRLDPALQAGATRERTAAVPDANDFRQFAALRRGAQTNDPQALREVARQFESLFTKMMLDGMRKASFGDELFGSQQVDMYQGMMDDQLAMQLSRGQGIGLADMLIRQLSQSAPGAAAPADAAGKPVSAAERREFVEKMLPHATAAARELGVDVRAVIAQAALETGWGRSQPADASGNSHNFFGIKAGASWSGATRVADTREYVADQAVTESARFRAYGSVAESVADYVHVLRDNPRYAAALGTAGDVRAFGEALQRGGYATDPAYADKLVAVARQVAELASADSFKSTSAEPIPTREPSRMSNG